MMLVTACGGAYWHIVRNLPDPVRREEPGDQHVGVWPVHLPAGDAVRGWGDLEASTLFVVEDRCEDTRGVEVRETEPIDRSVHPHQRHAVHVPNDPVVLYRLIGHSVSLKLLRSIVLGGAPASVTDRRRPARYCRPVLSRSSSEEASRRDRSARSARRPAR